MGKTLQFKISSALKNIIGRELITDDFIAVFELVKNSYDAHAKKVELIFENDKIIVADDGKGMSYDDLINKWLFLAYSAKKEGEEDAEPGIDKINNYRDKIREKRIYAGSKGIGRFSCDRLGNNLKLITKKAAADSTIEQIEIDWKIFEEDAKQEFIKIPVNYRQLTGTSYKHFKYGTILEISNLNEDWPRDKKLKLKHSLEKLINPLNLITGKKKKKEFVIKIISNEDKKLDEKADSERDIVNGFVKNFIFDTLNIKTTQVITEIDSEGAQITTELIDRGVSIYKIEEKNSYSTRLANMKCRLYFLNRAAKINFKKSMGIEVVKFGSIFLYRNDFRVYPFGEEGEDSLNIERRKQQGYNRYLGTRDLIGQIEIVDQTDNFKEISSRDGGLIKTKEFYDLIEVFNEKCLKRLEKYVVDVQWQISEDKFKEDLSLINNINSKKIIIKIISELSDSKNIKLLEYNKDFLNIIKEKIDDSSPEVYKNLAKIAIKVKDDALIKEINKAKKEDERIRKTIAKTISEIQTDKTKLNNKLKITEAENLFLKSIAARDFDQVINMIHNIGIYAHTIDNYLQRLFKILRKGKYTINELKDILGNINFENKKIITLAKFATKSGFKQENQNVKENLVSFFVEYINNIKDEFKALGLDISTSNITSSKLIKQFKPIEIMIIIDNMLSNSKKHGANQIIFIFNNINKNELEIRVRDNGKGFDKNLKNPLVIFEKGFTTTSGSGLGLFHIKQVVEGDNGLNGLNGIISINTEFNDGAEFILRIKK